jgi:hypothetical protein
MIYKIKNLLIILYFFSISFISFGEDPPPPPPCPGPSDVNKYVGGTGSPIEDGVPIVIGLALFYGAYKLHQARKKLKESEKEI